MSPEVKSKAFFPFYTTKGRKGTGLGLSVAYGIVSSYRGEILIESQPGKGSVFTLRFPASSVLQKQEPLILIEEKVGRLSILAVDDDENIRSVLSEMLDFLGHQVAAVEDGKKALDLLKKQAFDLVITDLGMPGISGWEVARTAKEKDKSTPVILISGWGSQIEPAKVSEVGIDKVLPKPFHMDDIRHAIGEACARVKNTPGKT
jgi:CheY-like chemotaxis protein